MAQVTVQQETPPTVPVVRVTLDLSDYETSLLDRALADYYTKLSLAEVNDGRLVTIGNIRCALSDKNPSGPWGWLTRNELTSR